MKNRDLKAILNQHDDELDIIISSDSEGNSYDTLQTVELGRFKKEDYSVRIGLEKLTPELAEQGYSEDDVLTNGSPCLILYP